VASGNIDPIRQIEGQKTKLTRTAHGIAYDPVHDLIIASEPFAGSIVTFRGGSHGNTPPLRVIQGPHTQIHQPWGVAVDPQHKEIWIADYGNARVEAFPLEANGDVAPLRIIESSEAGMRLDSGVAVDPERDLVVVAARDGHYKGALFTFKRTDNGDVIPTATIKGPDTGILGLWHVQLYGGRIFASVLESAYRPPYDPGGYKPMPGCKGPISEFEPAPLGFIGVWNETDNGDVPPRAIIRGAVTQITQPGGLALDPADGEIFTSSGMQNGLLGFLVPGFFQPKLANGS
jgi:hypothetical protein